MKIKLKKNLIKNLNKLVNKKCKKILGEFWTQVGFNSIPQNGYLILIVSINENLMWSNIINKQL